MPNLRRSHSLNDKVLRHKHRPVTDIVRDPRAPEAGGRTRTCLDNYQVLVHLRKQADDKSRQLELAYTYGANAHTFLRSGGGAQRASEGRPSSEFHPPEFRPSEPRPCSQLCPASSSAVQVSTKVLSDDPGVSVSPRTAATVHDGQPSAEGSSGHDGSSAAKCQGSFADSRLPQHNRSSQQQGKASQRPKSMFERGGAFPTGEEWNRKDHIIQNLMESQRCVNSHNQRLLGKVEELQAENAALREVLHAHNISACTLPPASHPHKGSPLSQDSLHSPRSESFPKSSSTLMSPISESSVSGYGSLAGSGYGEGFTATLEGAGRRMEKMRARDEVEEYNDDTLPLSEMSMERVGSDDSTLPRSVSSAGSSRVHTLIPDRVSDKGDLVSLHEKLDEVLVLERNRGSDRKKRIVELEQKVAELSEQRRAVLEQYKHILQEKEMLQRREESVGEELRGLLLQHGDSLQTFLTAQLHSLHTELQGLGQDIRGQLDVMLTQLQAATPSSSSSSLGSSGRRRWSEHRGVCSVMEPEVRAVMDKVVDLIGPEYLRLGRRLNLPPLELERIEHGREDFAEKTRSVLQSWLRNREEEKKRKEEVEEESGGNCRIQISAAQVLSQALRDIDKDICLFNNMPISKPERQALRNTLQYAIDHVTDPRDILDHMIMLSELTPSGVTFVQEVIEESRERGLCRLWHVLEYRGSGIISRLALALERAGHPHVSRRLTDELEIQNSRIHSQYHPLYENMGPAAALAAQHLGSRPLASSHSRSRPNSASAKSSSETTFEAVGLPVRPLKKSKKTMSLSFEEDSDIWDKRVLGETASGSSPRYVDQQQGSKISRV